MKQIVCFFLLLLAATPLTIGQTQTPAAPAQTIAQHRKRIDEIDKQVISLLNERAQIALEIGRIRQQANISPASAKGREEEVLRQAMENSKPPLSPAAARRIYERIIAETVAMQTEDSQKPK